MPLGRGPGIPLALAAVLLLARAHDQPTFAIGLDQSASGVVACAAAHVYLLEVPAGSAGFTVEVRGHDRDADLAVFFGDEELHVDTGSEPDAPFAIANPRAGTYRIVVANASADDLTYVLTVVTDGAEAVAAPDTAPIGRGACETDGRCRAP